MSLEDGVIVEGLPIVVGWVGYDPTDWRSHPDPLAEEVLEDDEDLPASEDVKSLLGFDPDRM